MSATTALKTSAAEEFARRVRKQFPESVRSIVLFGSVARGADSEVSDVDVLVLAEKDRPSRAELAELCETIDFENDYGTFLCTIRMTADKLGGLLRQAFPFAQTVVRDGMALYDDGTFERIRQSAVEGSGRDAD